MNFRKAFAVVLASSMVLGMAAVSANASIGEDNFYYYDLKANCASDKTVEDITEITFTFTSVSTDQWNTADDIGSWYSIIPIWNTETTGWVQPVPSYTIDYTANDDNTFSATLTVSVDEGYLNADDSYVQLALMSYTSDWEWAIDSVDITYAEEETTPTPTPTPTEAAEDETTPTPTEAAEDETTPTPTEAAEEETTYTGSTTITSNGNWWDSVEISLSDLIGTLDPSATTVTITIDSADAIMMVQYSGEEQDGFTLNDYDVYTTDKVTTITLDTSYLSLNDDGTDWAYFCIAISTNTTDTYTISWVASTEGAETTTTPTTAADDTTSTPTDAASNGDSEPTGSAAPVAIMIAAMAVASAAVIVSKKRA